MTEAEPIVFIVDDDLSVRRSTERLIRAAGLKVQTFSSSRAFLNPRPEGLACLVLDVRMPGLRHGSSTRTDSIRNPHSDHFSLLRMAISR